MTEQKYKYPRTFHLPWSEGVTKDDRIQHDLSFLKGQVVAVTLKMDGENTTMYNDAIHARSLDFAMHPSRHKIKAYWAEKRHLIPKGYRVCGENLTAKHSIYYNDLNHFFLVHSIWYGNECLHRDITIDMCSDMGFHMVPKLSERFFDDNFQNDMQEIFKLFSGHEGYVVRAINAFDISDFPKYVLKYVRKNHVQTSEHWMNSKVVYNKVIE